MKSRHFVIAGCPRSLHKVVSNIVWSSLQVGDSGSFGHIDYDAGNEDDLHPFSLPEFYRTVGALAEVVEVVNKAEETGEKSRLILTGHPTIRIPAIASYSPVIPITLAWQCVQSLEARQPELIFIVESKEDILRERVGAHTRNYSQGVLDRAIGYYAELHDVVRLDTTEGPKEAADKALEQIRKAL